MNFLDLYDFIQNKMRMSHVYQPVMLVTLLEHGGPCLAECISGFPAFAENDGRSGVFACTFITPAHSPWSPSPTHHRHFFKGKGAKRESMLHIYRPKNFPFGDAF